MQTVHTIVLGIEEINIGEEDIDIPYPFRNESWKDTLKELKPALNKENGKKGGAKKQTIRLFNEMTKEVLEFDSNNECMEKFGINKAMLNRFKNGKNVKVLTGWKIVV